MSEPKSDNPAGGIATLAADAVDDFNTESPFTVSGVALPVNTVVNGGQGTNHFYSAEVLEDAAEMLEGQQIVKNFHELDGQANADQVIGKITNAGFQKGVGLVFSGEIVDESVAEKVAHGFLDVSPTVARELGEFDDTMGAQEVRRISGFRDLAVVANGQPGAKIEPGDNPAITALSMDALSRGFDVLEADTLQRTTARRPTFDGTETSEEQPWGDVSKDLSAWADALNIDAESVADMTDSERASVAEHTLLGDADAEEWGKLLFFPVVNPNTGNLNEGALNAVRGGRGEQADIPADALADAQEMAEELLAEEFEGYEMEDGELTTMSAEPETVPVVETVPVEERPAGDVVTLQEQ